MYFHYIKGTSYFQPEVVSSIPIPRLRRRLKQHLPEDHLASVQLELDYGRGRQSRGDGEAATVNESRDTEFQDVSLKASVIVEGADIFLNMSFSRDFTRPLLFHKHPFVLKPSQHMYIHVIVLNFA